jgi:hypothetical protein
VNVYEERVRVAVETCRVHLDRTNSRNTEIEAYLTAFLLVYTYANLEEAARDLASARARRISDPPARAFATSAWPAVWRGLKVSELGEFLQRLGPSRREGFLAKAMAEGNHVAYGNVLANRHLTAHNLGGNMSFSELETTYAQCFRLIDAFAEGLDADA